MKEQVIDINHLLRTVTEKDNHAYTVEIDKTLFCFRLLTRREYQDIADENKSPLDKELEVCKLCVLYPEKFDFETSPAGVPTKLCESILTHSYLDEDAFNEIKDQFYQRFDDDSRLRLIIHEAFPEHSVEEIQTWDLIKTADYITRSEFVMDYIRDNKVEQEIKPPEEESYDLDKQETYEIPEHKPEEQKEDEDMVIKWKKPKSKKQQLTREKLRELQERYPDIDWAHDSVAMRGIDALKNQYFDDRPIAEIPIDDSEEGQNAIPPALRDRFKVIREVD